MIDVLQWLAIGLLAVAVLLLLSLLGKHDRLIRSMAQALADTAKVAMVLANTEMTRALRQPLVYCPTHGGQESTDDGRCIQCR